MVEISLTLLTTATTISTIIVVTMATLFFCCWRKTGSSDIVAGKGGGQNGGSAKEDGKNGAGSLASGAVGKSENGVLAENQSTTNGEMKLPLLSVTACANSNEELGDFSAVQRETEILRSYRKPPPPKNRGKQTRAQRLLKNGNDSSDIFTELSEEDVHIGNSLDKEIIASVDDIDGALLRSHSEDQTKSPRDTRSSMLADIEQTLAALHMSEKSEVVQTEDNVSAEHKTSTTESAPEVCDDNQEQKAVSELKSEPYAGDFVVSESMICPTSEPVISSEITANSVPVDLASSPYLSGKPKTGPKVSPKPSPKFGARVSTGGDATVSKHRDIHETSSVSTSSSPDNERCLTPLAFVTQRSLSPTVSEYTGIGVPEETSSNLQTILKSTDETLTNIIEAEKPLDSTGSDILSIPTDTVTMMGEDAISDSIVNGSNKDTAQSVFTPDTIPSTEHHISHKVSVEDTITEISMTTRSANESGEADFVSQEQSESETLVSDSKDKINPSGDIIQVPCPMPPTASPQLVDEHRNTQDAITLAEAAVDNKEQANDRDPRQEDEKQQKDAIEDHTGKGKISKIPIRSEKI